MKWLGQYIQDLTARFRHEVYLENISSGTIVSGGNLGLDSNNKIVKATVGGGGAVDLTSGVTGTLPVANGGTGFSTVPNKSVVISQDSGTDTLQGVQMDGSGEILIGGSSGPAVSTLTQGSNITITNADGGITIANAITNNNQLTNGAGYTTNTGDISGVKFITDSGDANCIVSSGNATFSLTGGEGIDVVNDNLEITVAGEDATTSNKGIASFNTNHFDVSSGAVSLKTAALTPNYSLVSSSGTVTTSATDGESYAVVIPYNTEQLTSSSNTIVLTGSSGLAGVSESANSWYQTTQGDYEFQWNVLSNTNVANNRILSGVKLQRGTHDGSTMTWADYDPSTSFIYDRGTGSIRKGSTTNQTLVTQGGTQYYWRLMVWKEESSNASTTAVTVVTGVSLIVKQIS